MSTEMTKYHFTVKEGESPAPGMNAPVWLMCEPETTELSIVGDNGFLGIQLRPGMEINEAEKFAKLLRANISSISYTKFR